MANVVKNYIIIDLIQLIEKINFYKINMIMQNYQYKYRNCILDVMLMEEIHQNLKKQYKLYLLQYCIFYEDYIKKS